MSIKEFFVELQNNLTTYLISIGLQKKHLIPLEKLGSAYGGWFVPTIFNDLNDNGKILVSAGIGHDVSFEIEMQKNKFYIIAMDPIKECCEFALNSNLNLEKLEIINAGLWVHKGKASFYAPKNPNHDAWSITNSQNTPKSGSQLFEVITFEDIINKIPDISNKLVMLKMDIEGAEWYLFEEVIKYNKYFHYIGIELDFIHLVPFIKLSTRLKLILESRKKFKNLQLSGLTLIHRDNFNFFWISTNFLNNLNFRYTE